MGESELPQFGVLPSGQHAIDRPGAYGVVFDSARADRIVVVQWRQHYFLPGGGVHLGESLRQAFVRELLEETGHMPTEKYAHAPEILEHSQRIARHYRETYKVDVSPERVIVTTGSSGGFPLAFLASFDAGDRVALAAPGYPAYRNILAALNLEAVDLPTSAVDRFQPTVEMLETAGPLDGLVVASPANPTGTMLPAGELAAIAGWCADHGVQLVSDEIYHGISYTAEAPASAWQFSREAIVVNSFSKYFGATGWRLGVIALHPDNVVDEQIARLPEEDAEALRLRYSSLTLDVPGLRFIDRMVADSRSVALNHTAGLSTPQQVQMALFALFALTHTEEEYHEPLMHVLERRLAALSEGLGVPFPENALRAGYYVELDLLAWAERHWGAEFAQWMRANYEPVDPVLRLAREDGVVLLNGGGFDGPEWSVRVSLANLDHGAYERIGRALREIGAEYHQRFTAGTGRS